MQLEMESLFHHVISKLFSFLHPKMKLVVPSDKHEVYRKEQEDSDKKQELVKL